MLDGTGGSSSNLTYMCMVEMILGLWDIAWKGGLKKRDDEKKIKKSL